MSDVLEKVILVGVATGNEENCIKSLDELAELAKTAGAETVYKMYQNRDSFHPGTYIGRGKIEELRELIYIHDATGIICDDELSPAQMKNLEDELDIKVMDRTMVILDIFASRASTAEGKIQVELAQLKYQMTRLLGKGTALSRLGGGIGTRGPGESKLETDRRRIRDRAGQLSRELKDVVRHREVTRKERQKNALPVFAIVGYTNAGKSTMLNKLTNAEVLSEDKLFATLDPTTRAYSLENGEKVLLTDTVGFINKLPHHLVEAFKSTLEEAKYADYIIHVVDSSNPNYEDQMKTVYATLDDLGVHDKTVITLFNKCDLSSDIKLFDDRAQYILKTSAVRGDGLEEFQQLLTTILRNGKIYMEHIFDYSQAGMIQLIRAGGSLLEENYVPEGIEVKAYVTREIAGKIGVISKEQSVGLWD